MPFNGWENPGGSFGGGYNVGRMRPQVQQQMAPPQSSYQPGPGDDAAAGGAPVTYSAQNAGTSTDTGTGFGSQNQMQQAGQAAQQALGGIGPSPQMMQRRFGGGYGGGYGRGMGGGQQQQPQMSGQQQMMQMGRQAATGAGPSPEMMNGINMSGNNIIDMLRGVAAQTGQHIKQSPMLAMQQRGWLGSDTPFGSQNSPFPQQPMAPRTQRPAIFQGNGGIGGGYNTGVAGGKDRGPLQGNGGMSYRPNQQQQMQQRGPQEMRPMSGPRYQSSGTGGPSPLNARF